MNTVIPDNVDQIAPHAFWNCVGLTHLALPNYLTVIGYYAFYGCENLTSITFPDNVWMVGVYRRHSVELHGNVVTVDLTAGKVA